MLLVTISKPIHQLNIKAFETIQIDYEEDELEYLFKDIQQEQLRVVINDSVEIINYKLDINDFFEISENDFFEQLEEVKNDTT